MKFMSGAGVVIVLIFGTGCAEDRYLTKEEDAEIRDICQPAGCVVFPKPVWQKIEQLLGGMRGS